MRITDTRRMLRIVGDLDRLLVGVLDPVLNDIGIGREHWQVLLLLEDGKGHAMGEISEVIGLTGATATRVVDSLAQKMLVYRRSDPLDRRRVLVYLAEPGQAALQRTEEAVQVILAGFDANERKGLIQLLERLSTTMTTSANWDSKDATGK